MGIDSSTESRKVVLAAVGSGSCNVTKAAAQAAKTKPEGAKKRTKMVRAQQEYIDFLLKRYPFTPFPGDPEELEKNIRDPVRREKLRIELAPAGAALKACRDQYEAIIKQYFEFGYAMEEVEVSDDDEA